MAAAISLVVILTLSIMIIRIAAVALRLTGLPGDVARFQARSAYTGAGFTTQESEAVVNYPVRRQIISLLMVVGNLGLVTVMATLILSFVSASDEGSNILYQILWLLAGLVVLWFVALNPLADRLMCGAIGWLLHRHTDLATHGYHNLLQVAKGYRVAEHRVTPNSWYVDKTLEELALGETGIVALGVRTSDGTYLDRPSGETRLRSDDVITLYGSDEQHAELDRPHI